MLNLCGVAALDSLKSHTHAHKSLAGIHRTLDAARGHRPRPAHLERLEEQARGLTRQAHVVAVRARGAAGEDLIVRDARFGSVCRSYQRGLGVVGRGWVRNAAGGEGKRALKRALDEGGLVAQVADIPEPALSYDQARGTITYLIPRSRAEEILQQHGRDPTQAGMDMFTDIISTGHHEIGEAVAAISLGGDKPRDIVHHTLGLVAQTIGPTFPHPEMGFPDGGSLEEMFRQHRTSQDEGIERGRQLVEQVDGLERGTKGGSLDHASLGSAIATHQELYGPQDPEDLESAQLAYRILERLHQIPSEGRRKALRRLYSGRVRTRAELEAFAGGG